MRKLVRESIYIKEEAFKGEIETGLTIDDVDKKEFLVGLAIEKKKHSDNLAVQKALVIQNLAKNPKYYSEGMKKGMFDDVEAINLYKKYFIDKEEIKESVNETMAADKDAKYDFAFAHEKVVETYRYCGFNVKVASLTSERFGEVYYAIADTGEPVMHGPYMHQEIFAAKREIEDYLDKYLGECEFEK
jgi:hypothetical protein